MLLCWFLSKNVVGYKFIDVLVANFLIFLLLNVKVNQEVAFLSDEALMQVQLIVIVMMLLLAIILVG